MTYELRIYTINKGMMDSWLKVWSEEMVPIHEKYGMEITGAWVPVEPPQFGEGYPSGDAPMQAKNEFIWVRKFKDGDDLKALDGTWRSRPERLALGDRPSSHIAKGEIRVMRSVLPPHLGS